MYIYIYKCIYMCEYHSVENGFSATTKTLEREMIAQE